MQKSKGKKKGVYGPKTRLCSQLVRLKTRLESNNDKIENKVYVVKGIRRDIKKYELKLDALKKRLSARLNDIKQGKLFSEHLVKLREEKELALSKIKRMKMTEEWQGESYSLLGYLMSSKLHMFDGYVTLIYLFLLNRASYKLMQNYVKYEPWRYGEYRWTEEWMRLRRPVPLNSELEVGDVVSILSENNPATRRKFDNFALEVFSKCPELKAWSRSELMLHKVYKRYDNFLDLVPAVELSSRTKTLLHLDYGLIPGKYRDGKLFVRIELYFRDKVWAMNKLGV
jgi:hypothetical protein